MMFANPTTRILAAPAAVAGIALLSTLGTVGCDDEYSSTASDAPVPRSEPTDPLPANSDAVPANHVEQKPTRLVDKTFDDIKFDIEPDAAFDRSMLTDEIEALFGQRIRIRGYILPTFQRSGIEQFVLVRDNQECCFGPGAALYDCIVVDMIPGQTADFSVKPVAVEGKFTLDEFLGPEGKHLAIFHLDGEKVK